MDFSYYALKILTSFILPPGIFILLFFISTIFLKKFRGFFMTIVAIFFLLSIKIVSNTLISLLEKPYYLPSTPTKDSKAVVVLGNGAKHGSPNLPLTQSATKRVLFALMKASENNLPLIAIGAKSEIAATKNMIKNISKDLKKSYLFPIYYDNTIQNTAQSAKVLKKYLKPQSKIILVTSATHMYRAKNYFENQNFKVIPMATDFLSEHSICYCWFTPSLEALKQSEIFIYEILSRVKQILHQLS